MTRRLVAALGVLVLATSSARLPDRPTILVRGHRVPTGGDVTVAQALKRAHVVVPSGAVLSVVTHRPLIADHRPGKVLLDGHPTSPSTAVPPGSVLTVVPGPNVTEPLTVTSVPVDAEGGYASLFVGGRAGTSRVVRGALSGETVSQRVLVRPVRGHLVAPRAIALTFDDGPDPRWTPQVLWLLARAHVHATFCLVGRHVAQYPALARAIVAHGHQLCNHTWSHDEQLATRSPERIARELARTQQAIFAATGVRPVLFRAPGGNWAPNLVAAAQQQGMAPLTWNVDPRDWARPGTPRILGVLLGALRPGAVVLLHDGGGDRSQTVTALRLLLAMRLGWSFQLPRP